jgi:hypothetical protein
MYPMSSLDQQLAVERALELSEACAEPEIDRTTPEYHAACRANSLRAAQRARQRRKGANDQESPVDAPQGRLEARLAKLYGQW